MFQTLVSPSIRAALLVALLVVPTTATASDSKDERDSGYAFTEVRTSKNFALKWGPETSISEARAQALQEELEFAWTEYIDSIGFAPPPTADDWLLNVYLVGTSPNMPDPGDKAGLYALDPDGRPMLLLIDDFAVPPPAGEPDWAPHILAHELFHAVQHAYDGPEFGIGALWFKEASADWAAARLDPESLPARWAIPAFAMLPHWGLGIVDHPPPLANFHEYGASMFLRLITDQYLGPDAMVRLLEDADDISDPLDLLDDLCDEEGLDVRALFAETHARNAVWDWPLGDLYLELMDFISPDAGPLDWRVSAEVPWGETDAPLRLDPDIWPMSWAANIVRMPVEQDATVTLGFTGDSVGDRMGIEADWRVEVSIDGEDGPRRVVMSLDDLAGTLDVAVEAGDVLFLTAAAVPDSYEVGERFGWGMTVAIGPPPPPPSDEELGQGCSCATSSGDPSLAWALLAGAILVRRRREATECSVA